MPQDWEGLPARLGHSGWDVDNLSLGDTKWRVAARSNLHRE